MTQRGGRRPTKAKPKLVEASNGDREVQAPQEVEGPNSMPVEEGLPDYPFVAGYICVPEQLYDMMVEVIFSLPYGQVGRLGPQIENLSQIHKALRDANTPEEGDVT